MVIIGNQDVLIPPPNSFQIAKSIPGAQLREIEGAGHIFWISHPGGDLIDSYGVPEMKRSGQEAGRASGLVAWAAALAHGRRSTW